MDKLAKMPDLSVPLPKSRDSNHLCTLLWNIKRSKTTTVLMSQRSDNTLLCKVALTISLYFLK